MAFFPTEEFKTQPVLEVPEVPEIVPEGVPEGEDKKIGDDMFFTRSATAVGHPVTADRYS